MPLGFRSINRGVVAFGFFHIETHLMLLEDHVFWCRDFCELFTDLARTEAQSKFTARLPGWRMSAPGALGDLHGAIAGRSHTGLIGELYCRWPFPQDPAGFRQKPVGAAPPQEAAALADEYGQATSWEVSADPQAGELVIDDFRFDAPGARALAGYVWRGGMPGWQEGRRPDYLWSAAEIWRGSDNSFLSGMPLDPDDLGFA